MDPIPTTRRGPVVPGEEAEGRGSIRTSRGVLNELARGFLLGVQSRDPESATRFASQFLRDQAGPEDDRPAVRPRTIRGPLPRASYDGRSLDPPPPPG